MPVSFFRKLKFGTLKLMMIILQMADMSIKHLNGIIEDLLVKVNDFIFPVDFVVLDMEEDSNVPLILEKPFLATGKTLIEVSRGELILRIVNKSVILSIYNAMKSHVNGAQNMEVECKAMHVVKGAKIQKPMSKKPLESTWSKFGIPLWLFWPCVAPEGIEEHEVVIKHHKKKKKKKKKKIALEHPSNLGVGPLVATPKSNWWKKRLAKMFLSKKKDANTTTCGEMKA